MTLLTDILRAATNVAGMSTNTLRLNGTVIVEGVAFGWFVTNGESQQLMGRHCTLGTQIGQLTESPESQAHVVGATMLRDAARTAGVWLH